MLPAPALLFTILPFLGHSVFAQTSGITCNATSLCPSSNPCCSEFGFCGTGEFCLGGCNPLFSHELTSCMPEPICQNAVHSFADNSRIVNASHWGGNASAYDWVINKGDISNTNSSGGELVLTLNQANMGTRISSTRYVHYGTITTRMKTGRWAGIVAAAITMSDTKDEIDWEFPGTATTAGQTNFYWLGVADYNNGQTVNVSSDTFSNYHDYTIDWQPDTLRFLVDFQEVRSISRDSAGDKYPTTPARIELSIWPAGINTSAPGTIEWAGGMINWNDPDYVSAGHFYTLIQSVTVNCSDPDASTWPAGAQSYVYGANQTEGAVQVPSIFASNQTTINGARSAAPIPVAAAAWSLAAALLALSMW